MELSSTDQAKTKFHLGYNLSVPAIDLARIQRAMTQITDIWTLARISAVIVRCEEAYARTVGTEETLYDSASELITGDITRTTTDKDSFTWDKLNRIYQNECHFLALALGVRNYRDPEQAINAYLIDGGTYINSIQGADGDNGSTWFSKSGVPTDGEFSEKVYDLCLDIDTQDLYQKSETQWTLITNIKGATGAAGVGSTWFSKSGVPTDGEFSEQINDLCLDTDTEDVYQKTDATTWTLITNIKGATGATGATGSVSSAGALELEEQGSSPTELSGKILIYAKTDNKLYQKTDDGTETELGSGGGGASITDIWLYGGF